VWPRPRGVGHPTMRHIAPHLLMAIILPGWGLKCYTGLEGDRWKTCDLHRGFRTCYTKYDPLGEVAGRGCSTKEKMYYVHCEAHEMEELEEKFCYCSFNYCNTAINKTPSCLLLLVLVSSCLGFNTHS